MNADQRKAFWSKVAISDNKKDCWDWIGAKKPSGYGYVRIDKKYLFAHRVAFFIINGEIPKNYFVCHICDNPACCNPNHLILGTNKNNAANMLIKNKIFIQYKLAAKYNVSQAAIASTP